MRKLQDTAVFQSVCQECYMGDGVLVYVKNGAILITIDPRNISVAKQADVWLQVRPGADCALALGMIKVMIEEKRIGYNEFPLWSGIKAPISACHNELAIKAMHTGKPYPIKALINHGTNLLTQFPEPRTVYKALKQLDLSIHFNYMMTPTAALADYVLPAAHWLERDEIPLIAGLWQPAIEARVQTVEPYGESRNEQQVILDIYWKLIEKGFKPQKSRTHADFIQWRTIPEFLDYCLKGFGATWEELKENHVLPFPARPYRLYEQGGPPA